MTSPTIINRLIAAKHQLRIAEQQASSSFSAARFATINNLHDSVEMFLLAVAEGVGSDTKDQSFDKYFVNINAAVQKSTGSTQYELPFKKQLMQMNGIRVQSKHHGVLPDRKEVDKAIVEVKAFYDEVCRTRLGIEFATVSLVDLVTHERVLPHLKQAQTAFETGNYYDCLVECRKAIYIQFEEDYDIQRFRHGDQATGLFSLVCKSPTYARDKDYIESNVRTPFDYIVINYSGLDLDLVKAGVPPETFWNIRQLTPEVYYDRRGGFGNGEWKVEVNFGLSEAEDLRDRAEYVLEEAVKITVKFQEHLANHRSTNRHDSYTLPVKPGTNIYRKASKESKIIATVPEGISEIFSSARVPSLDEAGEFFDVHFYGPETKFFVSGYITVEDIDFGDGSS